MKPTKYHTHLRDVNSHVRYSEDNPTTDWVTVAVAFCFGVCGLIILTVFFCTLFEGYDPAGESANRIAELEAMEAVK